MKKIILTFALFLSFFIAPILVKADVIPPNEHGVSTCVKIDNSLNNKLSEFFIVGYYEGPMIDGHEAYIVKTEDGSDDHVTACLDKGYKFNDFHLLAVRKSYLDKVGLENIDINSSDVYVSDDIALDQITITDSNPMNEITEIYSIDGLSNGKLLLDKEKQITGYNNGTTDKIETFENSNCVLDSCPHFSNFKCVSEANIDPEAICTDIYEMGDNCLQYVACGGESCQLQPSDEFTKCSNCIKECYKKDSEGIDIEQCSAQCSSAEVINQGKGIDTSPTPIETQSPIQKLISTGPDIYVAVIIISILSIVLVLVLYTTSNKKDNLKKE